MKKLFVLAILFLSASKVEAQKIWAEPEGFGPEDSITIYVDIKQCDCTKLVGNAGPLYMWTWKPSENATVSNGQWSSSNEELQMTNEGDDVWSFKMVPTAFYDVDAQTVYDEDIHLLVKAKDGGGGGTCEDEFKTEDLELLVDPPASPIKKVYTFPVANADSLLIGADDVFTLIYDNAIEAKESLQGITDFYVYPKAIGSDEEEYKIVSLAQVGNSPELEMTNEGNKVFSYSFIPNLSFDMPDGVAIVGLKFRLIRKQVTNSDDAVDGDFIFYLNNCN